jgi:hypothetical protein
VALSRHHESCHLYAEQPLYRNPAVLTRSLSRHGLKDSVLDYPLAFAERRDVLAEHRMLEFKVHIKKRLQGWVDKLRNRANCFIQGEQHRNMEGQIPLREVLSEYIKQEQQYHQLIEQRNQYRLSDPARAKACTAQALVLSEKLTVLVKQAFGHPDFQVDLHQVKQKGIAGMKKQRLVSIQVRLATGDLSIVEKAGRVPMAEFAGSECCEFPR